LPALDRRSTQKPEHVVVPGGQVQAPPVQNAPPVHALPHAPQFGELVSRLTQAAAHAVSAGPQLDWQLPSLHTAPLGQAVAHAPQFCGSEPRSRQASPHVASPAAHWQVPATQVDSPVHATPQSPQ
jgi:hypothetical protein